MHIGFPQPSQTRNNKNIILPFNTPQKTNRKNKSPKSSKPRHDSPLHFPMKKTIKNFNTRISTSSCSVDSSSASAKATLKASGVEDHIPSLAPRLCQYMEKEGAKNLGAR